jgi:hypothetical protein
VRSGRPAVTGILDRLLEGYDDGELEVLAGFLRRTVEAGRDATDDLVGN